MPLQPCSKFLAPQSTPELAKGWLSKIKGSLKGLVDRMGVLGSKGSRKYSPCPRKPPASR
eukprot:8488212-Alexandrium_andersonii.AAC.1